MLRGDFELKNEYKTKTRNLIIEYIENNADKRFTARDVYQAINTENGEIDRSTVYRNLERLFQEGMLVKYKETDSTAACYQYSSEHSKCHSHMHGTCSGCGKIFHLEENFVEEFEEKMRLVYGLGIDSSQTVIIGKCEDCKENK